GRRGLRMLEQRRGQPLQRRDRGLDGGLGDRAGGDVDQVPGLADLVAETGGLAAPFAGVQRHPPAGGRGRGRGRQDLRLQPPARAGGEGGARSRPTSGGGGGAGARGGGAPPPQAKKCGHGGSTRSGLSTSTSTSSRRSPVPAASTRSPGSANGT